MDITAARVRVWWGADMRPSLGFRRIIVSRPGVPDITALLLREPPGIPLRGGTDHADEHLVADADDDGPWPPVADVLIVRGPPDRQAAVRAAFPGWLVAVFGDRTKSSFLAVSPGWLARLVPLTPGTAGAHRTWPYASFVHAWTVAGRSLDALHGARLVDGSPGQGVRVIVVEHSTARSAAA